MNIIFILFDCINILFFMSISWNVFFYKYEIETSMLMIIFSMFLFILSNKSVTKKQFLNRVSIIIVPIYMMVSSVYSANTNHTLISALQILAITIYAFNLSKIYKKKYIYEMLRRYFIITIIFSIVLVIFFPTVSTMYYEGNMVVKGVFAHKNKLARSMIISSLLFLYYFKVNKNNKQKAINITFLILSIYLIYVSNSTTGIIYSLGFIILSILIYKDKLKTKLLRNLTYIYVLFFNIFIFIISNPKYYNVFSKISIFGKNMSFTGRNFIWLFSLKHIYNKLFLGYGYNSFWNSQFLNEFTLQYKFSPPHSHNGYIDIVLDGGIILLVLIILVIVISMTKNISNNLIDQFSLIILCAIIMINLTESTLVGVFWFLVVINCCFERNEKGGY